MMRKFYYTCSLLLLLFALPGLASAKLQIVATLPALAQLAQAVCGEDGEVRTLAKIAQDPHFVPPKPTLARHLADADILFIVGLGLESGWLPPLIQLSRNETIRPGGRGHVVGSDYIDVIGGDVKVDRSMGDVHPDGNPHWWLDPLRVIAVAKALAVKMGEVDPVHAAAYIERADQFAGKVNEQVKQWQLQTSATSPVVSYHDSYRYFVDRFGIKVVDFVEPKPGVEPSTNHLDRLVASLKQGAATSLWLEPYHDTETARRVCERGGIPCLIMPDASEGEGGDGYIALIDMLVKRSQQ